MILSPQIAIDLDFDRPTSRKICLVPMLKYILGSLYQYSNI